MLCCVANFWSWRVLVSWRWNIRAKALSQLVGVSGKCSDSCVGCHFVQVQVKELCAHPISIGHDGGLRSILTNTVEEGVQERTC